MTATNFDNKKHPRIFPPTLPKQNSPVACQKHHNKTNSAHNFSQADALVPFLSYSVSHFSTYVSACHKLKFTGSENNNFIPSDRPFEVMRSRTELVTTTFIDSEDDFTETDDSEEDWRPSASNRNVKKRSHTSKGRNRGSRKRKSSGTSSSGPHKNPRRQAALDANYQTFDDSDEDDEDDYEYYKARTQLAAEVEPKAIILPPKKKEKNLNSAASGVFQLYIYRKDLKEDYVTNPHLCLWRKDGSNLLQKYIRVKTGIPDEFVFTSSSVYSTWDEKRRRDFVSIAVKCLEENNRRVTFVDPTDVHSLARTEMERISFDFDQAEDDEIDGDDDVEADIDGSEHNSGGSDGSYHPEEEEPDDDHTIDDIEEEEPASDEDQGEEEYDEYGQIEEEDEGEEEDDNGDINDNENDASRD